MSHTVNICRTGFLPHQAARSLDDGLLIREAQRGSILAFEELVRRYDQAVLRLALRLTGSEHDAQDIYQEAFLKAYKNIGQFRSQSSFYTWIHRIVSNLCLDRLRTLRSRKEDSSVVSSTDGESYDLMDLVADSHPASNPERRLLQKELARHIHFALRKLTPRERMVFELRHYQGLRLRTVGEMLNTSEETAKNTLFRATHKLRTYLAAANVL